MTQHQTTHCPSVCLYAGVWGIHCKRPSTAPQVQGPVLWHGRVLPVHAAADCCLPQVDWREQFLSSGTGRRAGRRWGRRVRLCMQPTCSPSPFLIRPSHSHSSFGLWLDGDLHHGSSSTCQAFGNPPLAASGQFTMVDVEVFVCQDMPTAD